MKIQHGGGRHIDFRQMSISPGQSTANNWKTAFSVQCLVVESAGDDYNFYTVFQKTCDHIFDDKLK